MTESALENGYWWSTQSIAGSTGGQANPVPLSQIKVANPEALIFAYGVNVGTGAAGSISNVDTLTFGCTTSAPIPPRAASAARESLDSATGNLGSSTGSLGSLRAAAVADLNADHATRIPRSGRCGELVVTAQVSAGTAPCSSLWTRMDTVPSDRRRSRGPCRKTACRGLRPPFVNAPYRVTNESTCSWAAQPTLLAYALARKTEVAPASDVSSADVGVLLNGDGYRNDGSDNAAASSHGDVVEPPRGCATSQNQRLGRIHRGCSPDRVTSAVISCHVSLALEGRRVTTWSRSLQQAQWPRGSVRRWCSRCFTCACSATTMPTPTMKQTAHTDPAINAQPSKP